MRNPIPAQHRLAARLLAFGFLLGAAFQMGVTTASQISPRVEVIEVHHEINRSKGADNESP